MTILLALLLSQSAPIGAMMCDDEDELGANKRYANLRCQTALATHEQNVRDRHYVLGIDEEENGNHHLAQFHYEQAFQFDEGETNHSIPTVGSNLDYQIDPTRLDTGKRNAPIDYKKITDIETGSSYMDPTILQDKKG